MPAQPGARRARGIQAAEEACHLPGGPERLGLCLSQRFDFRAIEADRPGVAARRELRRRLVQTGAAMPAVPAEILAEMREQPAHDAAGSFDQRQHVMRASLR